MSAAGTRRQRAALSRHDRLDGIAFAAARRRAPDVRREPRTGRHRTRRRDPVDGEARLDDPVTRVAGGDAVCRSSRTSAATPRQSADSRSALPRPTSSPRYRTGVRPRGRSPMPVEPAARRHQIGADHAAVIAGKVTVHVGQDDQHEIERDAVHASGKIRPEIEVAPGPVQAGAAVDARRPGPRLVEFQKITKADVARRDSLLARRRADPAETVARVPSGPECIGAALARAAPADAPAVDAIGPRVSAVYAPRRRIVQQSDCITFGATVRAMP